MIVCVRLPYFAANLEQRDNPALEEPLLIAHRPPLDQVFACSQQGAQRGVKAGMSLRQARLLCPQASLIPANPTYYQAVLEQLLAALAVFANRVELGEVDSAALGWADLGPLKPGQVPGLAQQLGRAVRETIGLSPALGVGAGKFVAYVAALATQPDKALVIAPGREAAFLAPFPVGLLPLEAEVGAWWERLGIRTLGQLAALPLGAVVTQCGRQGRLWHQLASGDDQRPVIPYQPQAREQVSHTFDTPLADQTILRPLLQAMAHTLAARLQDRGQLSREVWLYLHLANQTMAAKHQVLTQPTAHPERLSHRLNDLLANLSISCGISDVTAIVTDFVPALGQQLDLFTYPSGQAAQLRQTLPNLVARYGPEAFYWVSLRDQTDRFPERRFYLRKAKAA